MVSDGKTPEVQGAPVGFVGGGAAWSDFLERLKRAASSGATVLLEGEHGVGKGFLARWVHQISPRAQQPLVELDLSTGSPHLLESLLFGHEEGAFTGARGPRLGAARRAEGGTLVLRGVHDLALELQVKLLRLLQERVVEPLGSERSIPVDVRILATGSQDLPERVRTGEFREDLYYRLAVVVMEVPPLRVRFEEAPLWLPALAGQAARRVGRPERSLSDDAIEFLAGLGWPGNVRQLENALERVLVLGGEAAQAEPMGREDFGFLLEDSAPGGLQDLARQGLARGISMDAWVGALLEESLSEHRGSMAAAARALGLSRKAFEYRLQKIRRDREEAQAPTAPSDAPGEES